MISLHNGSRGGPRWPPHTRYDQPPISAQALGVHSALRAPSERARHVEAVPFRRRPGQRYSA